MSLHLNSHQPTCSRRATARRGLTLIELLSVTAILVIMAGAMTALTMAVQTGSDVNWENSEVAQNGRVALERIERAVSSATANEQFPGCFVYAEQLYKWSFPDTLVVWHPRSTAAAPDDGPLINELVVFCPNPDEPSQLWEIRLARASGPAPALDDAAGWQTLISAFKHGDDAQRVPLTDLLRTAKPADGKRYPKRGVVRFDVRQRPSADQWQEFQTGSRVWEDLAWAQGIHGSGTGLRQVWCRIELQLQLPGRGEASPNSAGQAVTPFFGSGTIYHELQRS